MKTKQKNAKKGGKAKKGARKGGVARKSKTNVSEFASLSCTRSLGNLNPNTMYSYDSFALADFERAVGVAQWYQHYRITGITLIYRPSFDTFISGAGVAKPNLYYMIDKSGSIPDNVTLEALKQTGAKPHTFDEKPVKVTWRPSVLTEDLSVGGGATPQQYKVSPWLSTNRGATNPGAWVPSAVNHLGIKWYMDQQGGPAASISVEVQLQFQFKKALAPILTGGPAVGLSYPALDDSPDGIVGGNDGITGTLKTSMYH